MKAGSGSRGGRFYQLMALFLTYSAIVAMLRSRCLSSAFQEKEQEGSGAVSGDVEESPRGSKGRVEERTVTSRKSSRRRARTPSEVVEKIDQAKGESRPTRPRPRTLLRRLRRLIRRSARPSTQPPSRRPPRKHPSQPGKRKTSMPMTRRGREEPDIVDVKLNAGVNPAFASPGDRGRDPGGVLFPRPERVRTHRSPASSSHSRSGKPGR